jgi:hypothetical protein
MKIATVKTLAAKFAVTSLAAGAFLFASPAKSQAQRFSAGVRIGNAGYIAVDNGYRYDGDRYRDHEYREHEQREAFARRQAYLAHQRWEAEQREAYARRHAYLQHEYLEHHHDRDGYR